MGIIKPNNSCDALSLKQFLSVIPKHWIIRKITPSTYGMLVRIELFMDEHASGYCFNVWIKSMVATHNLTDHENEKSSQSNLLSNQQIRLVDVPTQWLKQLYESTDINFIAVHSSSDSEITNMHFVLVTSYIKNRLHHLLPNWRKLQAVAIEFPENNILNDVYGQNKMEVLVKHHVITQSNIHNVQDFMRFSSLLTLYLQKYKNQKIETVVMLMDRLSMTQNTKKQDCTTRTSKQKKILNAESQDPVTNNDSQSIDEILHSTIQELEITQQDSKQFYQQISLFDEISSSSNQGANSSLYDLLNKPQTSTPY